MKERVNLRKNREKRDKKALSEFIHYALKQGLIKKGEIKELAKLIACTLDELGLPKKTLAKDLLTVLRWLVNLKKPTSCKCRKE